MLGTVALYQAVPNRPDLESFRGATTVSGGKNVHSVTREQACRGFVLWVREEIDCFSMVSVTVLGVPPDARAAVEVRRNYTSRHATYPGCFRHTHGLFKLHTMRSGFPSRTRNFLSKSGGNMPDASPIEQLSLAERFVVQPYSQVLL